MTNIAATMSKFEAPPFASIFEYKGNQHRVTGFLKYEIRKYVHYDVLPMPHYHPLVHCNREEATYVTGSGIRGCMARVDKVKFIKMVDWDETTINDEYDYDYYQENFVETRYKR